MKGGAKTIFVFGDLSLVGTPKSNQSATFISESAPKGSKHVKLKNAVDWTPGDVILIGSTSFESSESEKRVISSVNLEGSTIEFEEALSYRHLSSTVNEGPDMSAEVLLLSRRIIIDGLDSSHDGIGARILISSFSNNLPESSLFGDHSGSAIIKNVEIRNAGQLGYLDYTDYRAAIIFDYGDVGLNPARSSLVENCSAHDLLSGGFAAMAVNTPYAPNYGPMDVAFSRNVVHNSIESAFKIFSDRVSIRDNVAIGTQFITTEYTDEAASRFIGTFEIMAENVIALGNRAGGGQSVGFLVVGQNCTESPNFVDNAAHGYLYGAVIYGHSQEIDSCTRFSSFSTWKTWVVGVFPFGQTSFELDGLFIADSYGAGFIAASIGPRASAVSRAIANQLLARIC